MSSAAACNTSNASPAPDSVLPAQAHNNLKVDVHSPIKIINKSQHKITGITFFSPFKPRWFDCTLEAQSPNSAHVASIVVRFSNVYGYSTDQVDKISAMALEIFSPFLKFPVHHKFKSLFDMIAYYYEFPHELEAATKHNKIPLTVPYTTTNDSLAENVSTR